MNEAPRIPREGNASRMVRSTVIVGASNAIATLIRIARMKVFAIYLGPAGVGLVGLYASIMGTAAAISGLGLGSSGVRQVAEAKDDPDKAAGTLFALRYLTLLLAFAGALGLVISGRAVSSWTVGNDDYVLPITLLSAGVFFQIVADSQLAVLNGLRRVGDLARINVIGSGIGTAVTIAIVWSSGAAAIPAVVVLPVLCSLICSWWVVRRLHLPRRTLPWPQLKTAVLSLLRLGLAFMLGGLMMTGALLFTRLVFVDRLGLAATGLFQAGWGIAVTNIDFILNAMGIDFYPHLVASAKTDRAAGNNLVNEQTEVALLLGGPVIIGMLTFAGPLILVFFSGQFAPATGLLRWLVLGSVLKILSWPISFLILAHGWARVAFFVELVWSSAYVGLVYVGISYVGIDVAGYAFVTAYLIYGAVVYAIVRSSVGFSWSRSNLGLAGALLSAGIAIMALVSRHEPTGLVVGGIVTVAFGIFSTRRLFQMAGNATAERILLLVRRKAPRLSVVLRMN